ncbi:hypothetical protein MMC11_000301 [Xylographa trunciseda]|nr:hypothetical protein [Xylographa trunciseda]
MEVSESVTTLIRLLQEVKDVPDNITELLRTLESVKHFQASWIDQDLTQAQDERLGGLWKHCHDSLKEIGEDLSSYARLSSHGFMGLFYTSKWMATGKRSRLTRDLDNRLKAFNAIANSILLERRSRMKPAPLELPESYAEFDRKNAKQQQNQAM